MRIGLALVVLSLVAAGCGSQEPSSSPNELLADYVQSSHVKNDRWREESRQDAIANFFAYYKPDHLTTALMRAYECDKDQPDTHPLPLKCDLNPAINDAAKSIAGGELYGRSVVVEHKDGGLELVTLYVVQGAEESVLVDETGSTYSDLEDFRANNGLLTADDTMLTLRDITAVPGEGKMITVTGHSPWTWQWWALGMTAAVALGVGAVVARQRAKASGATPDSAAGEPFTT